MILRSGKIYHPIPMPFDPIAMDQILQQQAALNTKLDDIGSRVTTLKIGQTGMTL